MKARARQHICYVRGVMYLRVNLVMADSVAMQIIVVACVVADSPRCVQCCFSVAVSPGHLTGRAEWKTDMRTAIVIMYTCTDPDDVRALGVKLPPKCS
jgi:hypothetical protein